MTPQQKRAEYMRKWRQAHPGYSTRYTQAWAEKNREKDRAYKKKWASANHDKERAKQIRYKYGISMDDYLRMELEQDHGCAICGRVPREGDKPLAVDHCHATNIVRGLLCEECNMGLGCFQDDPARLREAADYLEGKGTYEE